MHLCSLGRMHFDGTMLQGIGVEVLGGRCIFDILGWRFLGSGRITCLEVLAVINGRYVLSGVIGAGVELVLVPLLRFI